MENSGSTTIDRHQQVEEVSPTNKPKAMAAMAEREPRPKPEQKVDCPRCYLDYKAVEEVSPTNKPKAKAAMAERKPWPKPEQKVDCPRCKSPNTKFSYYNNYNMSQPRYFCKACRRYWTHGGSLRNVPIGGRCRKIRQSEANNNNLVAMAPWEPMVPPPTCMGFPNVLPTFISAGFELPSIRDRHLSLGGFVPSVAPSGTTSFLDVLRGGVLDGGYGGVGNNGMVQMPLLAMTYGSTMQHGTIGGATVAQGAVNGTMSVIEEGGLGDGGDMKRMMGIQWQHLNGGIGLGSGTNVELQQQGNVSNSVDSGGSSSRDCNWNNGGWQSLINSSSSG